jgi:hypothetical protein
VLGSSGLHVDRGEAQPHRIDERRGRIDCSDGFGAQPCDELRSQCSGSAPDVQRPLTRPDVGPLHELHGQRLGVLTHEPRVRVGSDVEAHRAG